MKRETSGQRLVEFHEIFSTSGLWLRTVTWVRILQEMFAGTIRIGDWCNVTKKKGQSRAANCSSPDVFCARSQPCRGVLMSEQTPGTESFSLLQTIYPILVMNLRKGRQWLKFWMCENVISWMSSMKIECPRSWRLIHNIFFSIKWEYNWRVLAWDEMRCYRIQQLPVFYCNSVTKQYNYTIIHKITDIMKTNARCFF